MLLLFMSFIVLLVLKAPIGFALISSSLLYIVTNDIPIIMAAQRLAMSVDSFPLLAAPFFIFAGAIMNSAGITKRIFAFAEHLVGHLTGGLGHANVLASVIFSGMSGNAIADVGGLGAIELKAMRDGGYDEDFSLAVTGASSIIGPIIPPSVPAVIYAVTGGISTGRLFAAGVVPGLIMALILSVMIYFMSKKKGFKKRQRARMGEIFDSFKHSFFAILSPVIILGGIIIGIFTPTEAAIVAVAYSLVVGFLYGTITLRDIPRLIKETLDVSVSVFFIIAGASLFALVLTISQVPQTLATNFVQIFSNKYVALFMINIFLLIVGFFMEPTAAIMILVPILMPVITILQIDPVHFGIVMIVNLMIGLLTPPVGMVLYVLSSVSKVPFERIAKVSLPFVIALGAALLLFTYVPEIVLFVPNALFN